MAANKSIGVVIASSRTPRIGPSVVDWALAHIKSKASSLEGVDLHIVDVKAFKLNVFDETIHPAAILKPEDHTSAPGRAWATEIAKHDGYLFFTPEYNYGMAGSVKNAIDFLFHEWTGKPVALISYGIGGGKTANEQITHVFTRMGMSVMPTSPQLKFSGGNTGPSTQGALSKGELAEETWKDWDAEEVVGQVVKAFEEVKDAVLAPPKTEEAKASA
jgi:NAD(P)H-dependent FMN reductase